MMQSYLTDILDNKLHELESDADTVKKERIRILMELNDVKNHVKKGYKPQDEHAINAIEGLLFEDVSKTLADRMSFE